MQIIQIAVYGFAGSFILMLIVGTVFSTIRNAGADDAINAISPATLTLLDIVPLALVASLLISVLIVLFNPFGFYQQGQYGGGGY